MHTLLGQMGLLVFAGLVWQWLQPGGLAADVLRRAIADLVYYLLLPALVLLVLWSSPLGLDSLRISLAAASGVLGAMVISYFICRLCGMSSPTMGAVLLAAAFPNATYLGLPVLEGVLGSWARSIAIQYDLFACTPLLLTLGIYLAQRLGSHASSGFGLQGLLRIPALWAAALAIFLNLAQVPMPELLQGALERLASGVAPLMLLSVGMRLRADVVNVGNLGPLISIVVIQLLLMPALVWLVAANLGLEGEVLRAVVLEGAMPCMLLGVVICDRYGLDTGLFAGAVTLSTLLSFITLPLWFAWV